MKILITPRSFSKSGQDEIRALIDKGFTVLVNETGNTYNEDKMKELCRDIDGLIVGIDPVSEKVLESAEKLKAISKYGAGLDNIDLDKAKSMGIKIKRADGANSCSVAELAAGLMFSLARNTNICINTVKKGGWKRPEQRGVELTGKTVGIAGLGHIGRHVARICSGIGMKVTGYDPYIKGDEQFIKDYGIMLSGFEDMVKKVDFLTLHVPFLKETENMINEDIIKQMKNNAYIINVSRGELVDEEALYKALVNNKLAGAAQDVFKKEPPDKSPLLTLDNFLLTPHIGAYTMEANKNMVRISTENLLEMLKAD